MTDAASLAPERGLLSRAIGVITAPSVTFESVVASPRPAGILLIVCLLLCLSSAALFTAKGQEIVFQAQLKAAQQRSSEPLAPQALQMMERMKPYSGYLTVVSTFIFVPAAVVVFSGLYWLLFNVILGGTAAYKQVLGVVAHSQIIAAVGALIGAPIQYAQGTFTTAGPFHLGALAPMLDSASMAGQLLTSLSFFGLWQSVVTALGFAVLYRRKPGGMIVTLLIIYVAFTALFFVGIPSLFSRR